MEALYTGVVTSTGGRNGNVKSSDGVIDLAVRPPKEMGGTGGNYTNPEQLFAATYSACYGGAYMHMALTMGYRVRPEVTAHVTINKVSDGFKISAMLEVFVTGISQEDAEKISEEAHKFCPYSRAIKGNVDVEIKVTAREEAGSI